MPRPTEFIDWASVGGTRIRPSSQKRAYGFVTDEHPPPHQVNWALGRLDDWAKYLDGRYLFGPSYDGGAFFNGVTDYSSFSTRVGSVYTLTRDVVASSWTIASGVTIKTGGFRILGSGTLTTEDDTALIQADGPAGANGSGVNGGAGGVALPGSCGLAGDGGAGGTAGGSDNGVNGANSDQTVTGAGGGAGGDGGDAFGLKGIGGLMNALAAHYGFEGMYSPGSFGSIISRHGATALRGGAGGGGGAASNAGNATGGGGGGAGGGVLAIAFRVLRLADPLCLRAAGGKGGNQATGGGGGAAGAGGGGGGLLYLIYADKGSTTFSAAVNTPGGAFGTGDSNNGVAGSDGNVKEFLLDV